MDRDGGMAAPLLVAASSVLLGSRAVLIRGPSGSGKSSLAWTLINAPGPFSFARLVCDDQTLVEARNGCLLARPVAAIAGRIEIRGLGIVPVPHEPLARVGLIADLVPADTVERLPPPEALAMDLLGIRLPRLPVAMHGALAPAIIIHAMTHLAGGGELTDFLPEGP